MILVRRMFGETTLRVFAWASVISEILIVVTGGGVRLTASGLGCPTWPLCTEESLVNVPEMGIHGIIEFGNRLLTFALLLIALIFFISTLVSRGSRKILSTSIGLIIGIFLQAIVGGISVLTNLNPWVVGLHFVISAAMIAVAAIQLWRVYSPVVSQSTSQERLISNSFIVAVTAALLVGIVVTGSGPHAGDAEAPRNGLNSELWQHIHSYPAYLALALGLVLLVIVRKRDVDGYASRLVFWSVITMSAQAGVGIAQSRMGLPVGLVIIHMTLAAVLAALVTLQRLALRRR
jgi:cytochrome c oxidase assembly protein subunit 15